MTSKTEPPHNPALRYLFEVWLQTCGVGWTRLQVLGAYMFSLAAVAFLLAYVVGNDLEWSGIQMLASGWIAWDLAGGVIGYSHVAIKRKRQAENDGLAPWHHNLMHIHPLMLLFWQSDGWLLAVTIYSMFSFFAYVELLEVLPATGERRLGERAQKAVIAVEAVVAAALIVASFVTDTPSDLRIYAVTVYASLVVLTFAINNTPVPSQRTMSIMSVVAMVFVGMLLSPPDGFQWLIPVFFLKLLAGFTAREEQP